MSRNQQVKMSLAYGELWVEITADGVSYAPDAIDDMVLQMTKAFSSALSELRGHGIGRSFDDDGDEIEVEFEDEESEDEEDD